MPALSTFHDNKLIKSMSITYYELLQLDGLSDLAYAKEMKRLFEVILNASQDEIQSIENCTSCLSFHCSYRGSKRQHHLQLREFFDIRRTQLVKREHQQTLRKERWWGFNLTQRKSLYASWQYSNIAQFRSAMQKEELQFRYAMDRFKQRHSNEWNLLKHYFSQPLYDKEGWRLQLQYWITRIKPKQDDFLSERTKVWQEWFAKGQYQKWLLFAYQHQKSKKCLFKNNEQFAKDIQSWHDKQFELFIGTIANLLLQQPLQMAQVTLWSKYLEKSRQYSIRNEVYIYFELKKFIRQQKAMKTAFRSKQWFQLRPRLLSQNIKKPLKKIEYERNIFLQLEQPLLPQKQKEQYSLMAEKQMTKTL